MKENLLKDAGDDRFPHAASLGVDNLYRYQSLPRLLLSDASSSSELEKAAVKAERELAIERLRELLINQWLFHAPPSYMNDPFEARPHYQQPENVEDTSKLRRHLEQVAKENGLSFKERKYKAGLLMARPQRRASEIQENFYKSFESNRLSSFTTRPGDLLFWSHYGDSHRGICFEYASDRPPIGAAFKVQYSDDYPSLPYPADHPLDMLGPLLTKSTHWSHENEFRTLIHPGDTSPSFQTLNKDQTHLLIPDNALTV